MYVMWEGNLFVYDIHGTKLGFEHYFNPVGIDSVHGTTLSHTLFYLLISFMGQSGISHTPYLLIAY